MTWTVSANGDDGRLAVSSFIDSVARNDTMPPTIKPAIVEAAQSLARAVAGEFKVTITTTGHFDETGKGFASVGVSTA